MSKSLPFGWTPVADLPSPDDPLASCTPLAREPLSPEAAEQVVPILKAIADPARLRLLSLVLSHEGAEACVCDLLPHFDLAQPTVSHHLKVLTEAGLPADAAVGVLVEAVGSPLPLVVERAMYRNANGQTFIVGTNALGTPLP